MVRALVMFAFVCGCVPVPDFVGITPGDGGSSDGTVDGTSGDGPPPNMVEVRVRTRDGFASTLTGALVVAVDPDMGTRNVATDSVGKATLEIAPHGTIYVLVTPATGHVVIGILDVMPGQTLEVGLPPYMHSGQHDVTLNGRNNGADTYLADGHCFSTQSASPSLMVHLDERCTTTFDALYVSESSTTGFTGWHYLPNESVNAGTINLPIVYQGTIPLDASLVGFTDFDLAALVSSIGALGDELVPRGVPVGGSGALRSVTFHLAAPTPTFLVKVIATPSSGYAQRIVASGDIVSGAANLTIDDTVLAPVVTEAQMTNKVVRWTQTKGTAQLLVIDGTIGIHGGTGAPLYLRYIKPNDGSGTFAIPDLPTVLDAYDLAGGDAGDFSVHLHRFPATVGYHDVAPIADAHSLFNDFYLVPALRPTSTSGVGF